MRFVRHGVEGQHNPGNFIYPSLGRGSFQQVGVEHVVQRAVAPFGDCVALGVVGRGEDLLNPERAQEFGPNGANELPASFGEKSSGGAKVGMTCRMRASLTVLAVWLLEGMRIVYLEKQSTKTIRNSWRRSGGSGPTILIDRVSHGRWD